MSDLTLGALLARVALAPASLPPAWAQRAVGRVRDDSRLVEPADLFVARRGSQREGLTFLQEALGRGALAALVPRACPGGEDPRLVRVADPGRHLGPLAQARAGDPSRVLPVVAVTGTNGKTTVVHLMAQLARRAGLRPATLGTLGHDTLLRQLPPGLTTPGACQLAELLAEAREGEADLVCMEASSHGLAQGRLDGVRVQVAVFTHLGRDHLDYHGSPAEYLAAKARLFEGLEHGSVAVLPRDGGSAAAHLERCSREVGARVVHYDPYRGESGLPGSWNAVNLGAAMAALIALGVTPPVTGAGSPLDLSLPPGRLEEVRGPEGGPTVVVDFAHNPEGLACILRTVREACAGQLVVVVGCGGERDAGKRPLMARVASELADRVVLTSDNPRGEAPEHILEEMRPGLLDGVPVLEVIDRSAAITEAIHGARSPDLVVIAGKGHETCQLTAGVALRHDDREVARQALATWSRPR